MKEFRRDLVVVLVRLVLIINFVTEPATLSNKGFIPYVRRARRRNTPESRGTSHS